MEDDHRLNEHAETSRPLAITAATVVALLLLVLFGLPHLNTTGLRAGARYALSAATPRASQRSSGNVVRTPTPMPAPVSLSPSFTDDTEFILVDSTGQAALARQEIDQLNDERVQMRQTELQAVIVVIPRDPAVPPSVLLPAPVGMQPTVVDLRPAP